MAETEQKKKLNPGREIICVLKLDTSSKSWYKTISKVLKTIEGVSYCIDAEGGKVTVYGMIDPAALMTRLRKSCKHIELVRVDAGSCRESRVKALQKEKELAEDRAYYERYGCYPQVAAASYNRLGSSGYAYPASDYNHLDPYYRSSSALPPPPPHPYHQQYGHNYPNGDYYPQQYGAPPVRFSQPPPPLDNHMYYDPDTQCRIM